MPHFLLLSFACSLRWGFQVRSPNAASNFTCRRHVTHGKEQKIRCWQDITVYTVLWLWQAPTYCKQVVKPAIIHIVILYAATFYINDFWSFGSKSGLKLLGEWHEPGVRTPQSWSKDLVYDQELSASTWSVEVLLRIRYYRHHGACGFLSYSCLSLHG